MGAAVVRPTHMYTFVILALPMQYARAYFLDLQFLHDELYKFVDHALLTYVCHVLGRNYCFISVNKSLWEKDTDQALFCLLQCSCFAVAVLLGTPDVW